ncbi:MAG: tryptophan halogenase family protein [Pseudomonadota bacterium]|nr:tryptophan halogenase family protein [Pseudomonadota bacterium]
MNDSKIKNIVILGGGTAGWMTANLLHKKWQHLGIQVTVVESPDIGIIGVGEGSTPLLKVFFDSLDIEESEWMPACNATYKNGISFVDWSTVAGYESYFHPFPTSLDFATFGFLYKYSELRRQGLDLLAHPNRFSLLANLTEKRLAPLPAESFPFHFQYGYHFDSVLIGKFLRERAKEKGIIHIEATVESVEQHDNGDIKSLKLNTGQDLSADFFVDCSGFASILIQNTLKVRFLSFAENLFNDSAIAVPTEIDPNLPSETISTALPHGWVWKIPLTNRFGNGYVYSSQYTTPDEAETELRTHLGILESDAEARHLKMKVGRTEQTWCNNCVAIGLSQGFIEPLEATALQFVYSTIDEFSTAFEEGKFTNQYREDFNERMNKNFEGIRDYIVLHYKTNSRIDTQYWIDNRENQNLSDNLKEMLNVWYGIEDLEAALTRLNIGQYYSQRSWTCLLAGMGIFPRQENLSAADEANMQAAQSDLDYVDKFIAGCSLNFQPHAKVLASD